MGNSFSECTKAMALEDISVEAEKEPSGPRLVLRVATQRTEPNLGAETLPFESGDEVSVIALEPLKSWDPLQRRFEQCARQAAQAAGSRNSGWRWPASSPRCSVQRRFFLAHCVRPDGAGGYGQHRCLLQVATEREQRRIETFQPDLQDAKDAASHAHRFNLHLARSLGHDDGASSAHVGDDVPRVKVAIPVGCYVVGGISRDIAAGGDLVALLPYSATEVHKFVFDGSEDFLEIPHTFFHYTACQTGGNHMLADLQGYEDDSGGLLLVDPMVLRTPAASIGSLLAALPGAAGGAAGAGGGEGPSAEYFELVHPKCGELCKAFDPQRRSANQRRHCGMGISCGVGGA